VQAAYEQQIMAADRQRLVTAASNYRAAFQTGLTQMPQLLAATTPTPLTSPG
jgi:hypothetical protein